MIVHLIEEENNFTRTNKLREAAKDYLVSTRGGNIIIVSPHIKIKEVSDAVKGDNYFNSTIVCIHPFDRSARMLVKGKVTQTDAKDFLENILPTEVAPITVFFDNPNLRDVGYIANKIRDNTMYIDEIIMSIKPNKFKFAEKALVPKDINYDIMYM